MESPITILKFQCCHITELSSMIITVPPDASNSSFNLGIQQMHIVRCREFIFTDQNIIGYPSPDMSLKQFCLIFKKSKCNATKLQARLKKLNFKYSKILPVDHYTFNQALLYTIQAHLAPQWNKVGNLLLQGRKVIFQEGKTNAISLEVNMGDDGLKFIISGHIANSKQITLYDLLIPTENINEFRYYPRSIIPSGSINQNAIYVLPSFKQGMVASIHRSLPLQCPFESYQALKRHWKNHYGYRLPDDEKQIYYFQIKFRKSSQIHFTYPSCCIRGAFPILNARVNQEEIVQIFLHDLHTKMPKLLGDDLQLANSHAVFPTNNFTNINSLPLNSQIHIDANLTYSQPDWKFPIRSNFTKHLHEPEPLLLGFEDKESTSITDLTQNVVMEKPFTINAFSLDNSIVPDETACSLLSTDKEQSASSIVGEQSGTVASDIGNYTLSFPEAGEIKTTTNAKNQQPNDNQNHIVDVKPLNDQQCFNEKESIFKSISEETSKIESSHSQILKPANTFMYSEPSCTSNQTIHSKNDPSNFKRSIGLRLGLKRRPSNITLSNLTENADRNAIGLQRYNLQDSQGGHSLQSNTKVKLSLGLSRKNVSSIVMKNSEMKSDQAANEP